MYLCISACWPKVRHQGIKLQQLQRQLQVPVAHIRHTAAAAAARAAAAAVGGRSAGAALAVGAHRAAATAGTLAAGAAKGRGIYCQLLAELQCCCCQHGWERLEETSIHQLFTYAGGHSTLPWLRAIDCFVSQHPLQQWHQNKGWYVTEVALLGEGAADRRQLVGDLQYTHNTEQHSYLQGQGSVLGWVYVGVRLDGHQVPIFEA